MRSGQNHIFINFIELNYVHLFYYYVGELAGGYFPFLVIGERCPAVF